MAERMIMQGLGRRAAIVLSVALLVASGTTTAGCPFSDSDTGEGGAAPEPTTPPLRWWATCPLSGCPDPVDPPVPCNSDQREGAPCAYANATCDAFFACGALLVCSTVDPKTLGCN